jgi:spore germination protein GerM
MVGALLVVVLGTAACATGPAPTGPAPTPAPTPAPAATPAGADAPERALPVYYVVETPVGPRLQREFHRVAGTDDGSDAVREMLASPTGQDPDHRSPWPAGTRLREPVAADGGVITVDLTGLTTGAQVGTAGAEMAVQQLVHTVQGALGSTDPVRILLDGAPWTSCSARSTRADRCGAATPTPPGRWCRSTRPPTAPSSAAPWR